MSKLVLAAAGGLFLAAPVWAQEISHSTAIGLGFNSVDLEGDSADGLSLDLESQINHGRWTFDLHGGKSRLSENGVDLDHTSLEFAPTYWFSPNVGGGVYLSHDRYAVDSDGIDLDSAGVELAGRQGIFSGALHLGQSDVSLDGIDLDGTMHDAGLRVKADLNEAVSFWGATTQSRFEDAGTNHDVWAYSIGGSTMFGQGFGAYASYQAAGVENTGLEMDVLAVGGSWTTEAAGNNVMLSAEYATANGDSPIGSADGDRLSLGATVLFGDAKRKRTPAHSVTSNSYGTSANAFGSALGSIGF